MVGAAALTAVSKTNATLHGSELFWMPESIEDRNFSSTVQLVNSVLCLHRGVCVCVSLCIWCVCVMCPCVHVFMYVYMYVWCVCVHVCVHVCTCVRVCVFVHHLGE